jgi:hypothetical protein
MAQLAIKGHETRGEEVIELLAMLGGNNAFGHFGNNTADVYYVDKSYKNHITCSGINKNNLIIFTLEEFLEKFPYKIGDKVKNARINDFIGKIVNVRWDNYEEEVIYHVEWDDETKSKLSYFAKGLQPYNEESMEGVYADNEINCYHQDFGDKVRIRLGNDFEIKVEGKITYIVKKQPQYPKTCEECCKILKIPTNGDIIYAGNWTWGGEYLDECLDKIRSFQKLLICRDAYWKIAGEQMGLGKPWEPDYKNPDIDLYVIINIYNQVEKAKYGYSFQHCILSFPTEEMRDAFFEYFKDLIESCKELP